MSHMQLNETSQQRKGREKRKEKKALQRKSRGGERALLYSPLAETRLTVYRQLQVLVHGPSVSEW